MKKVFLLVVLALSTLISLQSFAATAGNCSSHYSGISTLRDPGDTFPWGCEVPFPWRRIQGTWQTQIDGVKAYFSFRTIKTSPEGNQLQIIQYNPITCVVESKGVGFEDIRVVSAIMTDNSRQSLSVTVHVFNRADLKNSTVSTLKNIQDTVTVMNISPLGSTDGVNSYELEKISSDPNDFCF